MGQYVNNCDKCDSSYTTQRWEPKECPFCELEKISKVIPDGYRIAKDTLVEQVQLMVDGLMAYSAERQELLAEIVELENKLNH